MIRRPPTPINVDGLSDAEKLKHITEHIRLMDEWSFDAYNKLKLIDLGQMRLTSSATDQTGGQDGDFHVRIDGNSTAQFLNINGTWVPGLYGKRVTVNDADYPATRSDFFVEYTALSAPRTVTLPAASGTEGFVIIVKDGAGGAAANNITVDGNGAETIDGVANIPITINWGVLRVYSTGGAWRSF